MMSCQSLLFLVRDENYFFSCLPTNWYKFNTFKSGLLHPRPIRFMRGHFVMPFRYSLNDVMNAKPSVIDPAISHTFNSSEVSETCGMSLKNSTARWTGDDPTFSAICQLKSRISPIDFFGDCFPGLTLRFTYCALIPTRKHF